LSIEKTRKDAVTHRKEVLVRLTIAVATLLVAAILIEQLGISSISPIRQNVTLTFSQSSNQTVTLTGDQINAELGSPISNTISYFNGLLINSTGGQYSPMLLTQLTATNSNDLPITVETFTNQTNFELQKADTYNIGRLINVFSATTTHVPYINSLTAQFNSGSLNITNGLFNNSLMVRVLSDRNYDKELNSPQQIITNVVSQYYVNINQSTVKNTSISEQYTSVILSSPTGQQAVFDMNISNYLFSGLFIANNQYLEGNVSYNHYLSIQGFTSLTLGLISYGINIKVPYSYVRQIHVLSSSSKFSSFDTASQQIYITNTNGETRLINGNLNFTSSSVISLTESGYYPNLTSNLELSYYVQSNDAMVYANGYFVYNETQLKYGAEERNWMSLLAGSLISIGIADLLAFVRRP
jgi:hypothetical protein